MSATRSEPRQAGVFLKDAGGLPPIKNYYEGAQWQWGERGFIFGSNQDARLDATAMVRKEIMRKSRAFEKNNAFQNRLADIFEQYTVGSGGLKVVSENKQATEYFDRWSQDCDALGICDFGTIQGIAARAWFVDGECFIVKVLVGGRLKIQLVESHRVETPPELAANEGISIIDGVAVDARGRKTGIWVNIGNETPLVASANDKFKFVSAEDVIHIYEPARAGMYRGLPFCYPVMNDLNDLDDLQKLVNQVAKQAALVGNVTTNRTGELSTRSARQVGMKIPTANAAGSPITKTASDYYNVKFGAQEIALQHGDSIKQFQADRPSLVEREHWDYLTGKISIGQGISKMLVNPYDLRMQGTIVRADLDISAAFLRARSYTMQQAVKRVFYWAISWAEDYDREVLRGGFKFNGYQSVTVRPPRSPNVDVGRNSKAALAELNGNARTYQDWYAEEGKDWREQFDQIAAERQLMEQKNITPLDLQNPTKGSEDETVPDEEGAL